MAKYGEGDARWIVEERKDGANVHNWHWSETNCIEYSRNFLTSLLTNLPIITSPDLTIKTTSIGRLDGEAYVNVRKGKIIPGYEISLTVNWVAEVKGEDGIIKIDGSFEVPYIADENADEDPEIRISVKDDGPMGKRAKDAFMNIGKQVLLEKIKVYVDDMSKGGPAAKEGDLEVKKSLATQVTEPVKDTVVEKKPVKPVEEKKKKEKEGFKSITLSEKFNCRAKDLFEIMMDDNRWKGFTSSNAKISKEVGGEFSIFDGSINGVNEELKEGKLIVQKWRFASWADGVYSTVRLTFEEPESGVTVVKLKQTGVPEEDRYGNSTVVENTERGWRELILNKIRVVFGFGM